MNPLNRLRRTTLTAWLAGAPLLASATALAFDSSGPEQGNVPYTLRAYTPAAPDAFVAGNCGITYHALDVDDSSCNSAWAQRTGGISYTAKVFHSAYANAAGDSTDPDGMAPQVLTCLRLPEMTTTPPADLSQCHPATWDKKAPVSGIGWVKARHAWNTPPAGEWQSFTTPEHMLITQAAASIAGFDGLGLMSHPYWTRYPTRGDYVTSPSDSLHFLVGASYVPSPLAAANGAVSRPYYLPELAQLPDASFSVSDWAAGNETCPVPGVAATTPGGAGAFGNGTAAFDAVMCHDFGKLLGTINTSHFKGSNQVYWSWYHGLALQRMAVCSSMATALTPYFSAGDLAAENTEVNECEREAMIYEMFAQHFLQDAWSTGHMWKRWGSPELTDYPADFGNTAAWMAKYPDENLAARRMVESVIVGVASGEIHGTKAVSQSTLVGYIPLASDDPLSAPTMHLPFTSGDLPVKWNSGGALFPGAGDYYWAPLPTFQKPSISADSTFTEQRKRLLGCAARSMRDVYLAGPRLSGPLGASSSVEGMSIDSIDPSSDFCWGQWATNQSMLGALAPFFVSRMWGPLGLIGDVVAPFANLLVVSKLPEKFESTPGSSFTPEYLSDVLSLYSDQWVLETIQLQNMFTLNDIVDGDDDTSTAQLNGPLGPLKLLGVAPNHLVNPAPGLPPSTYADRSAPPRADESSYPQDYFVQRMFRRSHLAETCTESSAGAVAALRQRCVEAAASGGDPEACTACVEAAEPHMPVCNGSAAVTPSKCAAIGAETTGYPPEWSDPTWRLRPLGEFDEGGCESASDEAVMYCTGTDLRDNGAWGLAESRDFVFTQTLESYQSPSQCYAPATAGTPQTPLYIQASTQQVAVVKYEGDPAFQAPGPLVTALKVDWTENEEVIGDNLCKSFMTTSLDAVTQSVVAPFPMMFDTGTADQALIGNPWTDLDMATCGAQQRYTLWNRTCDQVVHNYAAMGSFVDLSQTHGLAADRQANGWGFEDSTFANNAGGLGSGTDVPEVRCAIVEPRKYDRACPGGLVCGAGDLCVPALSHPVVSSYLSYW
ncbi:MAG TPA: hypothetical protein VGI39_09425 [Polyangiaceae bacterium]|jgi:hypothetical protein